MKFNFRKVASVLASVVMLGSTIGIAAAAPYPAPFVQSGVANVGIVAGSSAAISDWAAMSDIGVDLQKQLATQTAVAGTSTGSTSSGGDAKIVSSSSRKLYYGDAINDAVQTITSAEMPNVLGDGSFSDLSGTKYTYTQNIIVGGSNVTFGNSGGDLKDPTLLIDLGNNGALTDGWIYNYSLSLNKNLNVSDSTNVQGQKIKILGVDYVIGASSTNSTLYLYGAGETAIVTGGTPATVTIGNSSHTVELTTTSSATAGTIKVDGVSKSVTEGNSYTFAGELNVYVKDIIHPAYAGDLRQAELIIGANSLQLTNGQTVKLGSDATAIKGTKATITAAGVGLISKIVVAIGAAKSSTDSLEIGQSFSDPVFGGLKVSFASAVPDLNSSARGTIKVETDNNQYGFVTFTSARAGTKGAQKLTYVYDNNTATTAVAPLLAHQTLTSNSKGFIHVLEGEAAKEGDWIVINQGDAGTILSVDSISIDTATTGKVTFSDVITGEAQTVTVTNLTSTSGTGMYQKTGVNFFGGQNYIVNASGADAGVYVNVTWSAANTKTLFPRIKLANGGWLALLTQTALGGLAAETIILPDGLTSLGTSGTSITNATTISNPNGISWGFAIGAANTSTIRNITAPNCNFNVTMGPAILYIEPKKWDDSSYGNFICVPLSTSGTTEIGIGDPVFNGTAPSFVSLTSDTYQKQSVDKFGAYVIKEDRTNENGVATIKYPSSQMYLDVVFAAPAASIIGGSSGGGTVSSLGSVTVSDAEYSKVSAKNVIVVGGSCINTVAAKLLGSTTPVCSAAFENATGIGSESFLIQSFDNPDAAGKVALLVAGYDAGDTTNAAKYLVDQKPDTAVGKKYKGSTATSATLV